MVWFWGCKSGGLPGRGGKRIAIKPRKRSDEHILDDLYAVFILGRRCKFVIDLRSKVVVGCLDGVVVLACETGPPRSGPSCVIQRSQASSAPLMATTATNPK